MELITINSFDGTPLRVRIWKEVVSPIGIVQIAHGIFEHSELYSDIAEKLQSQGFIVFCNDHRGLGLTEPVDGLGYHDGDIFEDSVNDLIFLNRYFKREFGLPCFILGHEYGSFLVQALLARGIEFKGVILSGSAYVDTSSFRTKYTFYSLLNKKKRSDFLATSIKHRLNSYYTKEKGDHLWITSNEHYRSRFENDSLCNAVLSGNFYSSLFKGLSTLSVKNMALNAKTSTPIALFSGRKDPIGGRLASKVIKLYKVYKKIGYKTVRLFIYEKSRNRFLSETDREVYMNHCITFINRCFKS